MRPLILALLLIAACSKKSEQPAPPPSGPTVGSANPSSASDPGHGLGSGGAPVANPETEAIAKLLLTVLEAGDPTALEALYMSPDEVKGMAECTKDQVAMRDDNVKKITTWIKAKPAGMKLGFLRWVEQAPIKLPKGKQAAGCTTLTEVEIINGTLVYTTGAGSASQSKTRGVSLVKTARGWKVSLIEDEV